MAKIEIDSRFDSVATMRAIAAAIGTIADEKATQKPNPKGPHATPDDEKPDADLVSEFDENGLKDNLGNDANISTVIPGAGAVVVAPLGADVRVDEKGVPFNEDMCAKAEKPFYASGPTAGQWKRKGGAKGPTPDEYDEWYATELALAEARKAQADGGGAAADLIDTSAAFSKTQAPGGQADGGGAPDNVGDFMGWVSEHQTAGRLDEVQIGMAYQKAGIELTDLFPPNPPKDILANIEKVWNELQAFL